MRHLLRGLVLTLALVLTPWWSMSVASSAFQLYGLELDTTVIGEQFCEGAGSSDIPIYPENHQCRSSKHTLPRISSIRTTEFPAPRAVLTFQSNATGSPETLTVWYAPRTLGGQSFLISATTLDHRNLEGARGAVLRSLGTPTAEFTPADLEARGVTVYDLSLDTLVFVDPSLPQSDRSRVVARVQEEFDPSGDELFTLMDSSLQTLARLLWADFRGAIVQVAESGFGHHSHVTTVLIDLKRARGVFSNNAE